MPLTKDTVGRSIRIWRQRRHDSSNSAQFAGYQVQAQLRWRRLAVHVPTVGAGAFRTNSSAYAVPYHLVDVISHYRNIKVTFEDT